MLQVGERGERLQAYICDFLAASQVQGLQPGERCQRLHARIRDFLAVSQVQTPQHRKGSHETCEHTVGGGVSKPFATEEVSAPVLASPRLAHGEVSRPLDKCAILQDHGEHRSG